MFVAVSIMLAGCERADDPNRVDVSLIGSAPRLGDPDREALDPSRSFLMRETAMGLVAFDANGQIEPALAESWIVTDDGRGIVFRIQRRKWRDGREVTGDDVAASLNRALGSKSENRLKPLLSAVNGVVGMTGRVVELRLNAPRPNLLQLLAQPELGIRRKGTGLGPWRIRGKEGDALVLVSVHDATDDNLEEAPQALREVHVKSGRAALAVARFIHDRSDLVMGGTLADWPIVQAANLTRRDRIRLDDVEGLFGLAIMARAPFLKERALRHALAMAVDREALAEGLALPRWSATDRLLPTQLDSGQPTSAPDWAGNNLNDRRALARQRIAEWKRARGPIDPVRVAMPDGPGMRALFARLAADWRAIGVLAVAVPLSDRDADLRLIDEIAPNNSANWYLTRTGCKYGVACSTIGNAALIESRAAPSLGQRSAAIARADAAYSEHGGYIPLGKPFRWSLVSPVLTLYRDNSFGAHPLSHLRVSARP